MPAEEITVMIAYDGSEVSQVAVRQAAVLFQGHPAVVTTVWEPGLAPVPVGPPDDVDETSLTPDLETIEVVDRAQHDHAERVAREGAELARSLGLAAEVHPVPMELNVADTLIKLADERDAAVVVVGSHGISGLRSRLLGSVARKLIEHSDRPVVVVREKR
jgi:nucleotide-binding universal stress UspA family protein